jgi:hypothetical protein
MNSSPCCEYEDKGEASFEYDTFFDILVYTKK